MPPEFGVSSGYQQNKQNLKSGRGKGTGLSAPVHRSSKLLAGGHGVSGKRIKQFIYIFFLAGIGLSENK